MPPPEGLAVVTREAVMADDERTDAVPARVVIIHGAMDRATSFAKVDRRLGELTVVRYDRRGYGRSIGLGAAPLGVHVRDALSVVGATPSVLVGHSVGGVVALAAAARHPELVRALMVFEAPAAWLPRPGGATRSGHEELDSGEAAERFMRRMIGDRRWERLPSRTRAARRAEGPALLADVGSGRDGPLFDPAELPMAMVVGYGTATDERHRRAAELLAATAPGAELRVIDGAQHGAHLTHPGPFAELIRAAVRRAAPAASPTSSGPAPTSLGRDG